LRVSAARLGGSGDWRKFLIAGEFADLRVATETNAMDVGGIPPVCFGEQIGNKGLPGEKCKRVRRGLKIRELLGRSKNAIRSGRVCLGSGGRLFELRFGNTYTYSIHLGMRQAENG
jgi:hypothetical protein